jgi:hypothetical protein
MIEMRCQSCDGWGHTAMDITVGKYGLFSGKKEQCPTQHILDGLVTLHCDWAKFKAAKLKLWPPKPKEQKAVNLAVLAENGNYTQLSVLGKRSGPMRLIEDKALA